MNYKQVARETYAKFATFDGNQHIAGDYALEKILKIIEDFKVRKVLEVGLGIGSVSDAILNFAAKNNLAIDYVGTEANDFCRNALKTNVSRYKDISLFDDLSQVPTTKFDLIIVDGSDDALLSVKNLITENGCIFIEGFRQSQVDALHRAFPDMIYCEIISMRPTPKIGPFSQKWTGGGRLIFIKPTLYQKFYCFNEKVKTFTKRRLRKIIG